jgi:hypothetical protein
MIPGSTSKCSEQALAAATTIYAKSDIVNVSDTTTTTDIATIVPHFEGFGGVLLLANTSGGNLGLTAAGNIAVARTIPDKMLVVLAYSKATGKWYPSAIS